MKPAGWVLLWILVCLLIWAPAHMMWLIPMTSQWIRDGEMTIGSANLIGLYSSLIPIAFIGAVNYYFFMRGDDK